MIKVNSNHRTGLSLSETDASQSLQTASESQVQFTSSQLGGQVQSYECKCEGIFLFKILLLLSISSFCVTTLLLVRNGMMSADVNHSVQPEKVQKNDTFFLNQSQKISENETDIAKQQKRESGDVLQVLKRKDVQLQLHNVSTTGLLKMEFEQAKKYFEIESLKQQKQLPFCLVLTNRNKKVKQMIEKSVRGQNYSNIQTLFYNQVYLVNQKNLTFSAENYYVTYQILRENCLKNSLILFINSPLRENALRHINSIFNQFNTWLLFETTEKSMRIVSFYLRVYELVGKMDFTRRTRQFLINNTINVQVFGIFKISAAHSKSIKISQIFANDQIQPYLSAPWIGSKWSTYFQINQRLSQDFKNPVIFDPKWKKAAMTKLPIAPINLSIEHMQRAIQFQQIWYLPENHSLAQLEHQYYEKMYGIDKWKGRENEVSFCVTILNYNNVQNDRYRKVLTSIIQQKYENYHLVIIDDFSSDGSLTRIKQFLQSAGFDPKRVVYIANTRRLYATYNIMNAVYNFCKQEDIQLLIDGDDELIGRHAFSVINSVYQNDHSLWSVYSNYKSNLYHFGRSRAILNETEYLNGNKRKFISYIGPIRTWRVRLLYHMPLAYQKMSNGKWFDTAYDDNIQYCLLELSTPARVRYIPEILYEYNRKYGDNDDSTPAKLRYRNQTYEKQILTRQPLKSISSLTSSKKMDDLRAVLENDRNVKYQVF